MHKPQGYPKFLSIHTKPATPSKSSSFSTSTLNPNKVIQLELQLKQAHSQIAFLVKNNKQLLQKLSIYERRCEDAKIMEQQLQFRREQEHTMQAHLDHYQETNRRLRQNIIQLQAALKNRQTNQKIGSRMSYKQLDSCEIIQNIEREVSRKSSKLVQSNLQSNRRSLGQIYKQNHPITPKTRVTINFQKLSKNQLDSMHKIKQRRKVFL